jgi:hypothetical protein
MTFFRRVGVIDTRKKIPDDEDFDMWADRRGFSLLQRDMAWRGWLALMREAERCVLEVQNKTDKFP